MPDKKRTRNPVVQAWIDNYQKRDNWSPYVDCHTCGWPHAPVLLCGSGSTFGSVVLGGRTFYIDSSNVDFMLSFVQRLGTGFHWKHEVFFNVEMNMVIVSHIESYNNTPHIVKWSIPLNEWQSIVDSVSEQSKRKASHE
jgi:hypothetical protein